MHYLPSWTPIGLADDHKFCSMSKNFKSLFAVLFSNNNEMQKYNIQTVYHIEQLCGNTVTGTNIEMWNG